MKKQYDVVIIGAGVVGSAIARELSRYKLSIAVLEKNLDVCNETSGRNSAVVHGGFANPIGSLKAKCCVEGNRIMDQLAEELNFPFKRCGKVLVGNTPEDMEQLERTMKQGAVNGCTGLEMIDEAKLHELVPAVVGKFAMWSKNSGIMDPFLYTVALAENAHANGVDFFFDHKVEAITRENELYYLHTAHGDFCTRWVVNAAGLGAKQISDLLGLTGYRVIGSRSNYIILHKHGQAAAHAGVPGAQQHLHGHPHHPHRGRQRDCWPGRGEHRCAGRLRCAAGQHGQSGRGGRKAVAPHL